MKRSFFILLTLFLVCQVHAHDIHVSVTDLFQNQSGELELTIKIFYDDLLSAVGLVPGQELPEDYTSSDDLIEKYLAEHVTIKINGKSRQFEYLETVASMPALWVYLKLDDQELKEIQNIEISNTIFIDLFSDQTNMVNIKVNNRRKSFALNGKKKNMTINW